MARRPRGWRLGRRARRELAAIYQYGAEMWSEEQAERYQTHLFELLDLLSAHPELARERTEIDPPVRIHPYGTHVVVYRNEGDGILVLRVLHARSDWTRHFQG